VTRIPSASSPSSSEVSKPPEGAQDSADNSSPKTPQAFLLSPANISNPPTVTVSHTPPSNDRQQVTGPPLALQQIGGQFTGDKSMVKEVCEEAVDQQGLDLSETDSGPSFTEMLDDILQARGSATSYASN
jgi:hypothetical protein